MLAALGGVLIDPEQVLSSHSGDVASRFLYTRGFAVSELLGGNFPLWNPFIYSGTPFLADFQSGLLYLPNLIFLFVPLSLAINWSFGGHLLLLGLGMYVWAISRGLGKAAAFIAGAAAMFSATVMLQIDAGHLSSLCSMAWMPFVFLGMDRWTAGRRPGWIAAAAVAAAMQVYAGQVQYFYFGAITAGLYGLTLLKNSVARWQVAGGLAAIYPLAAAIAAAQLVPGLAALAESMQDSAEPRELAAFLPLENFLTVLCPWFFGKIPREFYWGRDRLWEMNLFGGLGVFLLAAYGLWNGGRIQWKWIFLLAGVLFLSLEICAPLHRILLEVLPGLRGLGGAPTFIFFAGLFLSLAAGMGAQDLLARKTAASWPAFLAGGLAVLLLLASMWFRGSQGAASLDSLAHAVQKTGETFHSNEEWGKGRQAALIWSANALRYSGFLLAGFAVMWALGVRRQGVRIAVVVAAVVEVFFFARSTVSTFAFQTAAYEPLRQALWNIPGDFRILNLFNPDANMRLKREGIWGSDSLRLRRYSHLMMTARGKAPDVMDVPPDFSETHAVLEMFRCAYFALLKKDQVELAPAGRPYPRFYFVSDYEVLPPDQILARLADPAGDWRKKIFLEEEPIPVPSALPPNARVSVRDVSVNHYTLEIMADTETILVITDSYSRDWRVISLPGSAQITYRLLPVNCAMRGIPLTAGTHLLRVQYSPAGLALGVGVTLAALLGLAGYFSFPFWRRYLEPGDKESHEVPG